MKFLSTVMQALVLLLKQANSQNSINTQKLHATLRPTLSYLNNKIRPVIKLPIVFTNVGKEITQLEVLENWLCCVASKLLYKR